MKRMHLVWTLVCAGCGGGSFNADEQEATADGATAGSGGAPSTVRFDDDAGAAGASSGGSGQSVGGTGGKPPPPSTGGASVDAGPDVAEGGVGGDGGAGGMHSAGAGGTGGDGASGGIGGAGGNTGGTGGCELVTHDNGVGQTWQDCVPLETYNAEQALKACEAWCAAVGCSGVGCWTASACNQTLVVLGQVGSGDDVTTIAWSRDSGSVWQSGTLGCISGGTWR